ncbi:M28 family peptidase [Parvularcula marina]|uniref:M28 family peptidase n=1 Tax=Parvularcula marina TaxID=2292771 RepID=UPI00351379B3
MNFEPLLAAPWHIQLHAVAALTALFLGIIQFAAPKGTLPHRIIGPIWAILMTIVILTAIFIIRPRAPGEPFLQHFTFIHYIFIPVSTWGLIGGLYHVFKGGPNMKKHAGPFFGLFLGGLIIAGFFTFMPGRIMHDVLFNKSQSDNPYAYPAPYLYFLPGAEPPARDVARPERAEVEAEDATPAPDGARLMAVVTELSSDAYEGRATSSAGNLLARQFIIRQFEEIGLAPFGTEGFLDAFEWQRSVTEDGEVNKGAGNNILGLIPGEETGTDGPYFVITAHYDHLGTGASTDGSDVLYNGADDNASGVAVALELARYFSANPPKHSVVIAILDAEEHGLQGARSLLADEAIPHQDFALNLNLDMVSRADKGEIYASGSYHFPAMIPLIDEVAASAPLKLLKGHDRPEDGYDDWTYLSDQGPFIAKGIPALYIGVEDHPDYHQPSDTADKINPETFLNSARTILMLAKAMDEQLAEITSSEEQE